MAEKEARNAKNKKKDSLLLQALHGRLLSSDFFAKHWLKVLIVIVMILVYITNKYQCMTKMETIKALENIKVYRTDLHGDITAVCDGVNIKITTQDGE